MSFLADFRKFAFRGNVVDLAVGVIIGAAFNKIVTALVSDVVMPIVGRALPSGNWREAEYVLQPSSDPKLVVAIRYGDFLGSVVDFLMVALVLFVVVSKVVNAAERRIVRHPAEDPTTKPCPFCLETVPRKATRCKFCTSELR